MERAGRLIGKLKLSPDLADPETRARAAWKIAAGKKIAEHTRAIAFVRGSLVVEVEDYIWQRQLWTLRHFLIGNLEKVLGEKLVTDLDFRPMLPAASRRRMPQRAEYGAIGQRGYRRSGARNAIPAIEEKGTGLKLTEQEVRHVAELANLALSDEEIGRMAHDLDAILTHMDKLNELDTSGVEPMAQVLFDAAETATLREDCERTPLGETLALANAPVSGSGYFKVPKVIER